MECIGAGEVGGDGDECSAVRAVDQLTAFMGEDMSRES